MCRIADKMKNYTLQKDTYLKYKNIRISDSYASFSRAAEELSLKEHKAVLVAENTFASFYMDEMKTILEQETASFQICEIPDAKEDPKESLEKIRRAVEEAGLEKGDVLISLGGTYAELITGACLGVSFPDLRFFRIPLSFTAQLLSSGEPYDLLEADLAGILEAAGGNGAFRKPSLTYINLTSYRFLSNDERLSGMGEAIRASVSGDKNLFQYMEKNIGKTTDQFTEYLLNLVMNCLAINDADTEGEDVYVPEKRAKYGYTIARALERCTNYIIPHGSAAGIGMVVANGISTERGILKNEETFRIAKLMVTYGLSVSMNFTNDLIDAIIASVRAEEGLVREDETLSRFILLEKPGMTAKKEDVRIEEILSVMNYRRF